MSVWNWIFRRKQRYQELDEEIQTHLRLAAQERIEQGESPEHARAAALPHTITCGYRPRSTS